MDSGRVNAAGDIIATLSARVSELTKRVAMLQAELESATKRLAVYEEHDASIQDALSTALKSAYDIRQRAEIASGQLLEQAREERRMLLSEITRLRDERDTLQEEIAAQRRSSISAVQSRPLTSDDAAAELRAVASEALKGLFQEIVDEIRTTERARVAETPREEPRREEPRREEPRYEEPRREERRAEARRDEPPIADMPRTEPPQMIETPTYEAMKRIRRHRVTEDEDIAPQRADFAETAEAIDALLSFEKIEEAPPVAQAEAVAEPEVVAEPEPEPIAEAEPIVEPEAPAATVEPIEEVERFEEPVTPGPEPVMQAPEPAVAEPEPVAEEPEPVAMEPEPVAAEQEPVIEAAPEPAPEPVAEVPPEPVTQRPTTDWRTEAPAPMPDLSHPAASLPTSFAEAVEEPPVAPVEAPAEHDPRLAALGHAPEVSAPSELRPPLEVVRGPIEIRETHHPRVEAAAPTSDIQLVLSPVPSFPRLVEIERRIQSLPVVRTLYVRDFRAGAATLAVSLRSAMTPEEFASILAGLPQPRLRLVAGARNTLELRIEGEAGVA